MSAVITILSEECKRDFAFKSGWILSYWLIMYTRKENKSLYWPAKEIRVLMCSVVSEIRRSWK